MAELLASGDLSAKPAITGNDEITVLQNSFSRMMENLRGLVENIIRSFEAMKFNADELDRGINSTSQAAAEIGGSIRNLQDLDGQVRAETGRVKQEITNIDSELTALSGVIR
jgi:methyl-accepting chemotaxis protein